MEGSSKARGKKQKVIDPDIGKIVKSMNFFLPLLNNSIFRFHKEKKYSQYQLILVHIWACLRCCDS